MKATNYQEYAYLESNYCVAKYGHPTNRPLVMVGGIFHDVVTLKRIAKEFNKVGRFVIALDVPGLGKSDTLDFKHSAHVQADAIKHFLDLEGLNTIDLMGYSYGSGVAYLFAQKYPGHLRKLVLAGSVHGVNDSLKNSVDKAIHCIDSHKNKELADCVIDAIVNTTLFNTKPQMQPIAKKMHSWLIELPRQYLVNFKNNALRMYEYPLTYDSPPIAQTLVISGDQDIFTLTHLAKRLADCLPNSIFKTIANSDHLFYLSDGEILANEVEGFLSEVNNEKSGSDGDTDADIKKTACTEKTESVNVEHS